jgi:diguanylate cyclase (GGDEF)-like protein
MTPVQRTAPDLYAAEAAVEILAWQAPYRVAAAVLISLAAALLTLMGRSPAAEFVLGPLSELAPIELLVVGVLAYSFVVVTIIRHVRRTHFARRRIVALQSIADVGMICLGVFLLSDPNDYERMLLGGMLVLPLTYLYFGREPSYVGLITLVAHYVGFTALAIHAGAPNVDWADVLPTLAITVLGCAILIHVKGGFHDRLHRLAGLFDRAQVGEFEEAYDTSRDRRPDPITAVGRAYNRMRDQLVTVVLTDPLSGCFNRRGFEHEYRSVLARAARTHAPVAVVAVDLDHFKRINDTFGHLEGDRVITQTGALLCSQVRLSDIVARVGGEEFMLLLPDTDLDGAANLASRITEAFRARRFGRDLTIDVTVSVGVTSEVVRDESIAEDLRGRADEALYVSKRSGRDQVTIWEAPAARSSPRASVTAA